MEHVAKCYVNYLGIYYSSCHLCGLPAYSLNIRLVFCRLYMYFIIVVRLIMS